MLYPFLLLVVMKLAEGAGRKMKRKGKMLIWPGYSDAHQPGLHKPVSFQRVHTGGGFDCR
jgi:hypothetical protein